MKADNNSTSSQVLKDHTRRKKMFLPPMVAVFNDKLEYVTWLDNLLPELIWIGLILHRFNIGKANSLIIDLSISTKEVLDDGSDTVFVGRNGFAFLSDYFNLSNDHTNDICSRLNSKGSLLDLQKSLFPLHLLYNEKPFSFLFSQDWLKTPPPTREDAISWLYTVVGENLIRRDRAAMLTQAGAIYIMVATGKLRGLTQFVSAEEFQEIINYPETETSRKVAGVIRSSLHMPFQASSEWIPSFWNQNMKLTPCEFESPEDYNVIA